MLKNPNRHQSAPDTEIGQIIPFSHDLTETLLQDGRWGIYQALSEQDVAMNAAIAARTIQQGLADIDGGMNNRTNDAELVPQPPTNNVLHLPRR